MTLRLLLPTAFVMVVGIVAVGVFFGVSRDKPSAMAEVEPAATGSKESENPDGEFSPYVNKDGEISLPKSYKQNWAHLGSWAVARKRGSDVFEMHDVYT